MSTATPQSQPAAAPKTRDPKQVVRWFSRFCQFAMALFVTAAILAIPVIMRRDVVAEEWGVEPLIVVFFASFWSATMIFLALVHYAALKTPRSPWAWKIHAVVLGVDLTTLVLWPLAMPLLWLWFRPETKAFFGVTPKR